MNEKKFNLVLKELSLRDVAKFLQFLSWIEDAWAIKYEVETLE